MTLRPTERAWAAGFIDGEGYIGTAGCTHKGVARIQLQALLDVSQRHVEPLTELQRLYGGNIRIGQVNGQPCYFWRLYGAKAAVVLQSIRPYLVGKCEQADLVMAFQKTKFAKRKGNPNGMIAEAIYQHRLDLHERLRVLNARVPRHAERLSEEAPTLKIVG